MRQIRNDFEKLEPELSSHSEREVWAKGKHQPLCGPLCHSREQARGDESNNRGKIGKNKILTVQSHLRSVLAVPWSA